MRSSDFILKVIKRIQQKTIEERKRIQLLVVGFFLIVLLAVSFFSFKSDFSKERNSIANFSELAGVKKITGSFSKIRILGLKIGESFKGFKESDTIKNFFEKYGS